MINQKYLEEFINAINSIDDTHPLRQQLEKIQSTYELDDLEKILALMEQYKSTSKKIASAKRKKTSPKQPVVSYSYEEIKHILEQQDDQVILKNCTKNDLEGMYYSLFSSAPLKQYTKNDILKNVRLYFYSEKRSKAMQMR